VRSTQEADEKAKERRKNAKDRRKEKRQKLSEPDQDKHVSAQQPQMEPLKQAQNPSGVPMHPLIRAIQEANAKATSDVAVAATPTKASHAKIESAQSNSPASHLKSPSKDAR
jgi:hypothetical protein